MRTPPRKIHFVEFRSKINTLAFKKVFPMYGTPLLATILHERGHEVRVFVEGVSDMRFETLVDCDLLCIALSLPGFNKARALAERLHALDRGIPVVVGGPFASLFPERSLPYFDFVARCEGDEVLPRLIDCLDEGGDLSRVAGLSYRGPDGAAIHNGDAEPPPIPNVVPRMELIDGFQEAARGLGRIFNVQNLVQTSRGCKFRCRFCPTPLLFSDSFRNRDIDSVIEEIKHKRQYNDWFLVVDNSFFGDRRRARALLERLVQEDLHVSLTVFERQEIAHDDELLRLMKRAGVDCLVVGIESLEDQNLDAFNKRQKIDKTIASIKRIKESGIHVIGTFAFGYDGDSKEKVPELIAFIKDNKLGLTVFVLHDVYGEEGQDLLVPLNRRFWTHYEKTDPTDTSFYDYSTGHFVTYFPRRMKPSTLQRCIVDIYSGVYTHGYILDSVRRRGIFESLFGVVHGYSMKRMIENIRQIVDGYYIGYLEQIEDGLYDDDEVLIEERLDALEGLPIPRPVNHEVDMDSYKGMILLGVLPGVARYYSRKLIWRLGRALRPPSPAPRAAPLGARRGPRP